ncbi:MAG: hypothetical protein H7245_15345 [Candidatus Saccharibacteria bacterium]|nr:hypothetical protein [Pseudorhodobacter sp.]
MAFEKEIKEAQKICDAWMKRSVTDMNYLMQLKKTGINWEKNYIAAIDQMLKANDFTGALATIEEGRQHLDIWFFEAENVYKKHDAFIMGDPRAGTKGICNAIGLKNDKDPAYVAVAKAMDKELISQTKQFKETGNLFNNDLKPKVAVLMSKLDTLEKLAKGSTGKLAAYWEQFSKDRKAYLNSMGNASATLKVNMAEQVIKVITADPQQWMAKVPKARTDNYRVIIARLESVPKIIALSEKNYGRVIKSIPAEMRAQFIFVGTLKSFETEQKAIVNGFTDAEDKFKTAIALIKKNFPEATE